MNYLRLFGCQVYSERKKDAQALRIVLETITLKDANLYARVTIESLTFVDKQELSKFKVESSFAYKSLTLCSNQNSSYNFTHCPRKLVLLLSLLHKDLVLKLLLTIEFHLVYMLESDFQAN